jgi:hypothetical protein
MVKRWLPIMSRVSFQSGISLGTEFTSAEPVFAAVDVGGAKAIVDSGGFQCWLPNVSS